MLPALSVARQEFERAYKCTVDWGEVAAADLDIDEQSKIEAMLAAADITSSINQQQRQ